MARRLEVKSIEAFRYLRSYDIDPILIKGWAAARTYPFENPRYYVDIDLAVSRENFDRAKTALATAEGGSIGLIFIGS